jgi:3-dehydroquinate synthase
MFHDPVIVKHSMGQYPVYVAANSLGALGDFVVRHLPSRHTVMIGDQQAYDLARSGRWGKLGWTGETITFQAGELSKTRETWAGLTDTLLERRYGRDSGIVGLGGGVASDLTGFIAATYLRGVPHIQVPTTLLAMVDASVGGKTGVNTPQGKNLVGAFHPPAAVLADPAVLVTLPDEAYRGGLAEAIKHGLIANAEYLAWIEAHTDALGKRQPAELSVLVRRSVEIKARVVSADERESGERAILNAGHTVAHALERATRYQLPHGDAVALGLVAETRLAELLGVAPPGLHQRVVALLRRVGLPTRAPAPVDQAAVLEAMQGDKKNRQGAIHFALVADVGRMHRDGGWTIPVLSTRIAPALTAIS